MRTILIALALLISTPSEARKRQPKPIHHASQIGKTGSFHERFEAVYFVTIKVRPAGRE